MSVMKKILIVIIVVVIVLLCAMKPIKEEMSYRDALNLFQNKDYENAYNAFELMGDYKDSPQMLEEIREKQKEQKYEDAIELLNAGEYEKAQSAFVELATYKDSVDMVKKCKYEYAKSLLQGENYVEAKSIFDSIIEYGDAEKQSDVCAIRIGDEYKSANDIAQTLQYYVMISDDELRNETINDYYISLLGDYSANDDFESICRLIFNDYVKQEPECVQEVINEISGNTTELEGLAKTFYTDGEFGLAEKTYDILYESADLPDEARISKILRQASVYEYVDEQSNKLSISGWDILIDDKVFKYSVELNKEWVEAISLQDGTKLYKYDIIINIQGRETYFQLGENVTCIEEHNTSTLACENTYYSDIGKELNDQKVKKEEAVKEVMENHRQEEIDEKNSKPEIGMTAAEVKKTSWGSPSSINKTTYEWGVEEQWCYPGNKYVYLRDGVVWAITEN